MKFLFKQSFGFLLLFSSIIFDQEQKIGVVNFQALMESSPQFRQVMESLQDEFQPRQREALAKQKEFEELAEKIQKELETISQEEIAQMQKDIQDKGKDLEFLAGKIQQAQEETAAKIFNDSGAAMQKIIGELITAKQIKVLLAKNEALLFSDPALDLTDDVTSMLDVAASETNSQSE